MSLNAFDLIYIIPLAALGNLIWRAKRRSAGIFGPATRQFAKRLREAERLRATDPGQAKWIETRAAEQWAQSPEAQSIQVHPDDKALARLRERLSERLREIQEERKALEQHPNAPSDPKAAARAFDAEEQDLNRELAALDRPLDERKKLGP